MTGQAPAMPDITEAGTSRFAKTKRWQIHYNVIGAGTEVPVILIHGSGPGATGWSNFSPNIPFLARRRRVIAVDLPGWGRSDPLDPMKEYRQPAQAEAVKLLMDELGIERASLVGNSMGGSVAMQFAADYPDRIHRCVTMGAGVLAGPGLPNIMTPSGLTEGLRIIVETYRNPTPENFRRLVNIMVFDPSFASDALLHERSAGALANPEHLTNFLKPLDAGIGYSRPSPDAAQLPRRFSQLQTPCLFIHGRDDRVVHMEGSLRGVSLVPNASLHLINRCGHWTQLEHAAQFNAIVDAFISPPEGVDPGGIGFGG